MLVTSFGSSLCINVLTASRADHASHQVLIKFAEGRGKVPPNLGYSLKFSEHRARRMPGCAQRRVLARGFSSHSVQSQQSAVPLPKK